MLSNLLAETEKEPKTSDGQIRLLVAGSLMDEPDFLENVEDLGAVVVADTMCYGSRTFQGTVDEDIDPMDALVDRYFNHPSCPRMVGEYKQRLAFLKDQAGKARIDGVILEAIKFCDLSGTDNALLKHDLEKAGIPVVELERQYGPLADAGRIRTRVQAFIERIGR
jgi:benzoyl-CoA reductase/2-hydroxyglutaryl-CoA dehydratase subunit BcrC/BadD/HgdB